MADTCGTHRSPGMVNLVGRRCHHQDCEVGVVFVYGIVVIVKAVSVAGVDTRCAVHPRDMGGGGGG